MSCNSSGTEYVRLSLQPEHSLCLKGSSKSDSASLQRAVVAVHRIGERVKSLSELKSQILKSELLSALNTLLPHVVLWI